jgi:hypothetical protein
MKSNFRVLQTIKGDDLPISIIKEIIKSAKWAAVEVIIKKVHNDFRNDTWYSWNVNASNGSTSSTWSGSDTYNQAVKEVIRELRARRDRLTKHLKREKAREEALYQAGERFDRTYDKK